MATFQIELDDKGDFVGQLPPEVAEAHKRIGIMAHGNGFQAGREKAVEEAKKQLADTLQAERAKWDAQLPLEREKWDGIERENTTLKQQLTDTLREHQKTLTKFQESHAEEIMRRAQAIDKRNGKISNLVAANIRALLTQHGAADGAIPLLEHFILEKHVGFDEDMEPFVKGDDGRPMKTNTGNAVALDTFVKQYIESTPQFRKPPAGQGGGARGGASFHQGAHGAVTFKDAVERYQSGDRTAETVNDLFEASRRKKAS